MTDDTTDVDPIRARIASAYGIDDTNLLTGQDEAALTAQAQRLAQLGLTNLPTDRRNVAPSEGHVRETYTNRADAGTREFVADLFGNDFYG